MLKEVVSKNSEQALLFYQRVINNPNIPDEIKRDVNIKVQELTLQVVNNPPKKIPITTRSLIEDGTTWMTITIKQSVDKLLTSFANSRRIC